MSWRIEKLCSIKSNYEIQGIAVDNNGNIYFTLGSDGLWKINKHDTNIKPVRVVKAKSDMTGIVWDGNNTLYICDCNKHRIMSYAIDNGKLSTLTGNAREGHKDGNLKNATFTEPYGIVMDKNGDLYVAEVDRIRKINIGLGTVETTAGPTTIENSFGHQDGEAKDAKFTRPCGIAVSEDGTIFVCDQNNYCIRQIKNGIVSTISGNPQQNTLWGTLRLEQLIKDGTRTQALFTNPIGIAISQEGNLFVAEKGIRSGYETRFGHDFERNRRQDIYLLENG